MKISVIIPTYKPQSYIWECLDSLYNQTFSKNLFEVIIVLNGCKEPYESQIKEYLLTHKDLVVNFIQTDIGGVSNARNVALNCIRGEFVTFIDDDDFVSPTFLEELFDKASVDTIALCYPYEFNDGQVEIQLPSGVTKVYERRAKLGKQNFLRARKYFSGPWMKLFPANYLRDKEFDINLSIGEDSDFNFLISNNFRFVNYTSTNAIYYRRFREGGAIMQKRNKKEFITSLIYVTKKYTSSYFGGGYSLEFYLARLIAVFKALVLTILSK